MAKWFRCESCEHVFDRKAKLVLHTYLHTGELPFKCSFAGCERAFNRKQHLQQHLLSHSSDPKPFQCSHCDRRFTCTSTRKRHEFKFHSSTSDKNDLTLGESAPSPEIHSSEYTTEEPYERPLTGRELQCELCGAKLKQKSMKNHMVKIHSILNYKPPEITRKCKICGFHFNRVQAYLSHLNSKSHKFLQLPYDMTKNKQASESIVV